MNKYIVSLLLISGLAAAQAEAKTIPTVITCQQDDGDQWVEVGIVIGNNGYRALVVAHDVDDNTSKLIASYDVMTYSRGTRSSYQTNTQTFSLVIENASGNSIAQLDVLTSNGERVSKTGLLCYSNSDISID